MSIDGWVLVGDDFAFLADNVGAWMAYGIGLGCIAWLLGEGVALLFRFLRY